MNFEKTIIGNHLINQGLIRIVTNDPNWVQIKGVKTKSPVKINYMDMMQHQKFDYLVNVLLSHIPEDATIIAGANHGKLFASRIAGLKRLPFLPLLTDLDEEIIESKDLINQKIVYVCDVIATGIHTADALDVITRAHGECSTVVTIFDFNFHLSPKSLKNIKIKSLVTIYSLLGIEAISDEGTEALKKWMHADENKNLFLKLERDLLTEELYTS